MLKKELTALPESVGFEWGRHLVQRGVDRYQHLKDMEYVSTLAFADNEPNAYKLVFVAMRRKI